jgi:hypothetical protein
MRRRVEAEAIKFLWSLLLKVGEPASPYETRTFTVEDAREAMQHFFGDVAAAFPLTYH